MLIYKIHMQNRRKTRKRMQNRREMQKNALRHIFASGPCKYTRQAETAPSTYARIISRYVSAPPSLLKISAAIAFVCDCVLDRRQDIPRRPTLRALEPRDRLGQLWPADAAVELVRFDAMPAFAAVTPLGAERTLDVVVEAPRWQVVSTDGLVLNHDQHLSVRIS